MITAGGTGGHVYPALAAAEALLKHDPRPELIYVGTVGGMERKLVERAAVPFSAYHEVQGGPLHGVNLIKAVVSIAKLLGGTLQSWRLVGKYKPKAVFATGGWVSAPLVVAAWVRRVPVMIFLPDIEPGRTIKTLRRFAHKIAITVPDSAQYFREGQTMHTGYPLREDIRAATREGGIQHFRLDPSRKTLLVFGGSLGSRAINIAVGDILGELLASNVQVIHVTGRLDWSRVQEQVGDLARHENYHMYPYLHEIGLAFAASDLAVARAGASTLAEFPYFELPSILIPLAYSWRYQQVNAEYLAQRGAAVHLPEGRAAQELLPTIRDLFNHPGKLAAMRAQAAALSQPDGAENVAATLMQMARGQR